MTRVTEVLDVWFDSGVSSWAGLEYPKNEKLFKKFWPADLNIEGTDQFRGWWNSQLILSEIRFGKKPYENIVVHGMVLGMGKIKMSKSLGNIMSPPKVIEKHGRDQMRYYFAKLSKGEDFAFNEKEFREILNVFRILINVNNFTNQVEKKKSKMKIEDKWILSRFNSFLKDVKESYDKFKLPEVVQKLENFLVDDLSRTYIKLIRERENEVYPVLNKIRNDLLVVLAPIAPFITEEIWQDLKQKKVVKEESVHLASWPKADQKKVDKKLELKFSTAFQIIEKGLAGRDRLGVGLRWPLKKAVIYSKEHQPLKELSEIIKSQLNVKDFELKVKHQAHEISVTFDETVTPELEAEGYARELARQVQAFRKKMGLEKKDRIELHVFTDDKFEEILKKQEKFLKERTNSENLKVVTTEKGTPKETFKNKTEFVIKDKKGWLVIVTKR